jgi:D-3-phosphoglycerate dehydrogenase
VSYKVVLPLAVVNEAAKYPPRFAELGMDFSGRQCPTEEDVIELARNADAMIVEGSQRPITRTIIETLTRCRIIAGTQIGYDSIDTAAAAERGILVTNVPGYCVEEVTDHAMALILACSRRVVDLNRLVRRGGWGFGPNSAEMKEHVRPGIGRLRGKTLGLFGFGAIGRTIVPKAKGFGLHVIACDPFADSSVASALGVEMVAWDTLLRDSDFISIHAAISPQTLHVFNRQAFRAMKPTACLINTARGGFIDEEALCQALRDGPPAMAALDVLTVEPPANNPLSALENVICTGHNAYYSPESLEEQWRRPADEVCRVLRGEWPTAVVNPQAKHRFVQRWGPMKDASA